MPLASTILMVRPAAFGFNEETAANNFFQSRPGSDQELLQEKARTEFDKMVEKLKEKIPLRLATYLLVKYGFVLASLTWNGQ